MERSGMLRPTCRDLSHDTERCLKTKTTNLHRAPPLIMHIVVARGFLLRPNLFSVNHNIVSRERLSFLIDF